MPNADKLAKKAAYFDKLNELCVNSKGGALLVAVDHVRSKQMQQIRIALRGKAVVLMGKNTMIRKALALGHETYPDSGLDKLRAAVNGNIGFIFATECSLDDIRDVIKSFRQPAAAKAGQVAQCDLSLPAGPTGMDPSQTAFFQALNIGTKIVKGQIELVAETPVLKRGEKVSPGGAVLLGKLGVQPFEYGMEVEQVYQDGSVFSAAVLDVKPEALVGKFLSGLNNMAAFSREIGIPTEAGLPHSFGNAFRNICALCADVDFVFEEMKEVKKFLEDPEAYAAANPVATGGGGGGGAPAPAEEKKAAAVEEEEEDEDVDFDLFG